MKPILNKHGAVLLQGLTNINGKLALETKLMFDTPRNALLFKTSDTFTDVNGATEISYISPLPDIQDPQKIGSAITYFRRYALQSLLALEAEDDDANFASNTVKVKAKVKEIEKEEDPF